ncbi:MAG: peptidoglycan DD-metalloendopeptidase family protein [Candidatus Aminicenantes bacterium]|nr:peptidoglycan DD-metalloendopeptidase family protein [Candidatus Aminicenantes bacterium]
MQIKIKTYKKKRRKTRRIHLLLFIFLSFSLFLILTFLHEEKPALEEEKEALQQEASFVLPPLEEKKEIIRRGMTMTDILKPYNLSGTEIHALIKEVKPIYDLAKIRAGQELRTYSSPQGDFFSLEYDIDEENYLHVQRKEGTYKATLKKIPYDISVKTIWGVIEENLIFAVRDENEGIMLALNLADLFAWDIDFYADLRRGDSFKIIFEKKYLNGEFVGYENILAAEFTNQGKKFLAFRYTYLDTKDTDYFDLEGKSLRKEFLKSPIRYSRITSRFSRRRLHPIRKVYRPHFGVDYAASVGTPVQVTADGTVTFAGRRGASGRMISIRHKNRYETIYLHLRGYAPGIRKGKKVKGGQEIGYVGSSGESTGPHLDYRIKKDGRYINPLLFNPAPVKPLRAEFLDDFKKKAESYCLCFEAPLIILSSFSNSFPL